MTVIFFIFLLFFIAYEVYIAFFNSQSPKMDNSSPAQTPLTNETITKQNEMVNDATKLQSHILELSQTTVPPMEPTNLLDIFKKGDSINKENYVFFHNKDTALTNGFDSFPFKINGPFGIDINMYGEGDYVALTISGRLAEKGDDWWRGINKLVIASVNSQPMFTLVDGKSASSAANITFKDFTYQKPFKIIFHDSQGKSFSLIDSAGKEIKKVDITKLEEIDLPNGLFPDKNLYLGNLIQPGSILILSDMTLYRL